MLWLGGAYAAVGMAIDWLVAVFGASAAVGILAFVFLHRRNGTARCALGVCHLVLSPSHSYERVMHPEITTPVPYAWHRDVHTYARTMLYIAFAACVLKLALAGFLVWNPGNVFGSFTA